MTQQQLPKTGKQRRLYNQRQHAPAKQTEAAQRGPIGVAELWWDRARRIVKKRAAAGDDAAANDLALTVAELLRALHAAGVIILITDGERPGAAPQGRRSPRESVGHPMQSRSAVSPLSRTPSATP